MNTVDQIFSDKLAEHSTAPSSGAWARVEANLTKKQNTPVWFRWAAVLVPALITTGIWLMQQPDQTTEIVQTAQPVQPSLQSPEPSMPAIAKTEEGQKRTFKKRQTVPVAVNQVEPVIAAVNPEQAAVEELTIEPVELIAETQESVAASARKPIVIVYTLETVASDNDEPKKMTAVERVAEIAMTVKHSDPIGEFRELKDELLALDLRKKPAKKN